MSPKTVRVRFLTSLVGPDCSYAPKHEYDVPAEWAEKICDGERAVYVEDVSTSKAKREPKPKKERKPKKESPPETAVAPTEGIETATLELAPDATIENAPEDGDSAEGGEL